jgi:hypothetical protein
VSVAEARALNFIINYKRRKEEEGEVRWVKVVEVVGRAVSISLSLAWYLKEESYGSFTSRHQLQRSDSRDCSNGVY